MPPIQRPATGDRSHFRTLSGLSLALVLASTLPGAVRAATGPLTAHPDSLVLNASAPATAIDVSANDDVPADNTLEVLGLARQVALYDGGTVGTPPDPAAASGGSWSLGETEDGDIATGSVTANPSVNHNGSGLDAWVVDDQTNGTGDFVLYTRTLTASEQADADTHGWSVDATIAIIDDYGNTASPFLQYGNGATRFIVFFDLDASGDLTAEFFGSGGGTVTLASGAGALDFHDYGILYDPVSQTAAFMVDGVRMDGGNWSGQGSSFSGVQWGTGSSGGQGTAAFHRVACQVHSPTLTLASGAIVSQASGDVTFNPNGAYGSLMTGQSVDETIHYVIGDGTGSHATGILTVTVHGGNDGPAPGTLKLFVLTGQSNSLGTLATSDTTMRRGAPGNHPAEQGMAVPFFWDNRADGTPAGNAGLGDSGGVWVDLAPQTGGVYPDNDDHWGLEIGFARMLWNAGYRDFGIVKASRGGGGNSYWVKNSADDHMYDHVVATVGAAVATLPAGFTGYEIAGLLYLQGESNDATEANEADVRFDALLTNLKSDLVNATSLTGVFGEIGGGSTAERDLTRTRQLTLAGSRGDIGYASATGTNQHDDLHYDADSILLIGERMASEMIGTGALDAEPLPAWADLHAWFIADNAAQPGSSGTIDRWASLDDGSAARDLTRTVGGRPATRHVTAAGGTPREVMHFDGTTDLWASSGEFGTLADARSVAVLCRVTNAANGFLFDGSTSTGRTRAQVRDGDWQAGVSTTGWDVAEPVTAPRVLDQWQRHVFTFDDNGSSTDVTHWIDGTQVSTPTDADLSDLKGFIIGANGGSTFRWLHVEVAEVAVYNKVLDATDVATLETAWQSRWGDPTGPPFGTVISQSPREIPRFGMHDLVLVSVDSPSDGVTTLDEFTITLAPDSRDRIARVAVINGGTGPSFNSSAPELDAVSNPSTDTLTFTVNTPLLEGTNHFWIAIEPERWTPLGAGIDAQVDELVFSGSDAGTIVPADGNPAGELTLGLVPLISDIRQSGDFGVTTYRIPGIASDDAGVLHAVFDHRWDGGSDLPADIDVGYARSTDGGATWSGFQPILDYDSSVPGSAGNGVGDPCILWDPVTDTLWAAALWSFGNNGYNGSGPGTDPVDTGQYVLTKSTDGGLTWSPPINITVDVKDDPNWRLIFQGPGHGLAMRDGTLVFPSQYRDASGVVRSCSVFSTDHGTTWDFGSAVPSTNPQTNEMTLCELDDGRLLFSCRTPSGSNGQRAWAHYTPGGPTPLRNGSWEALYRLAEVPDPVCQGSVIQWKSTFDGHPREWVLFANPATGGRNGMTLRISTDGGLSWPVSRLVYSGPSAYSSLCILPDNSVGLLFEKDEYTRMTFVRVEEEWLLNPDIDTDTDGMPNAWEELWGTNPDVIDDGEDPDGDGMTNAEERAAGTDPFDKDSVLRILDMSGAPSTLDVTWSSIPGRTYRVETSEDLQLWSPAGDPITASGPETAAEITHGGPPRLFTRIGVLQ